MKKLTALLALIFGLVFPISTSSYAADIDKSDNKAPILVSIQIEKSNLVFNEMTRIKLIVRDDKNDMGGSIYLQFQSPSDAPGSLRPYVFFTTSGKSYNLVVKENGFIEYTYSISVKAPEWPGSYSAFQIFMLEDLNGNRSAFYLNQKCRNVNDAAGSQALAFPEVIPECNIDFTVRDLTPAEKVAVAEKAAQDKAADKAAADKAAADKAAADKAAAKAEIRALLDSVVSQISSLKVSYGENNVRVYQATLDRLNLALPTSDISGYPEIRLSAQKIQGELQALEQKFAKEKKTLKKTTIVCVKGKLTKKVTAVKPTCPSGYKKK
jgi:hypothetical protein